VTLLKRALAINVIPKSWGRTSMMSKQRDHDDWNALMQNAIQGNIQDETLTTKE